MRYGFVGLGHLGRNLAASLVRGGFEVVVHDLDPAAVEALVALGARSGGSAAGVGREVDAVLTCLPSPAASAAVMAGPGGALSAMRPGSTWIEMSTTDREAFERLAAEAAARGIEVLEAPVTGGVHRAAAGDITILVGGEEAVFARHRTAFEAMGGEIVHMGPVGSAMLIKVITNMLAFIHLVAAGEALMLARAGGLDLRKAFEAIRASSGNSFVHETESQVILNGSYDIAFTMDLAVKDLGFALSYGESLGVPLDLATRTAAAFDRARAAYGGSAWSSMVVKLLEDEVGLDLRAPGFPARL